MYYSFCFSRFINSNVRIHVWCQIFMVWTIRIYCDIGIRIGQGACSFCYWFSHFSVHLLACNSLSFFYFELQLILTLQFINTQQETFRTTAREPRRLCPHPCWPRCWKFILENNFIQNHDEKVQNFGLRPLPGPRSPSQKVGYNPDISQCNFFHPLTVSGVLGENICCPQLWKTSLQNSSF